MILKGHYTSKGTMVLETRTLNFEGTERGRRVKDLSIT